MRSIRSAASAPSMVQENRGLPHGPARCLSGNRLDPLRAGMMASAFMIVSGTYSMDQGL